jgi:hypothetical protein
MEESERSLVYGICLKVFRNSTKLFSHYNRSPGLELNPDLPNTKHVCGPSLGLIQSFTELLNWFLYRQEDSQALSRCTSAHIK